MIKNQLIVLGILSLIAVVGTTSTLSHAFALTKDQVLGLVDKASKGSLNQGDISGFASQATPDFNSKNVKAFADKAASGNVSESDVSSLVNSTSTG